MGLIIKIKEDLAALVDKRAQYRFGKKEEERSNHARQIGQGEWRPACATRHGRIAWSGPPHDIIETITCLDCGAWASKPEMASRGYDFDNCPDYVYIQIMDEKKNLRFIKGDSKTFVMKSR